MAPVDDLHESKHGIWLVIRISAWAWLKGQAVLQTVVADPCVWVGWAKSLMSVWPVALISESPGMKIQSVSLGSHLNCPLAEIGESLDIDGPLDTAGDPGARTRCT